MDTEGIKKYWKSQFKPGFINAYKKAKHVNGYLDTGKLANLLSVDVNFFNKTPFKKFLFKDSLATLSKLKNVGRVIILSVGDTIYQPLKISESGIEKIVGSKNVFISQNKKLAIKKIVDKLRTEGLTNIVMVDDIATNLELASKYNPKITNVWFRYGRYRNKFPIIKNIIAHETNSLTETYDYLSHLIAVIHPPKLCLKLSIQSGISDYCSTQLIKITGTDSQIRKFTHDHERFKNLKTFNKWKSRGKTVYTLIDKTGKLMGIIWFNKQTYDNIPYTFAVRTYKPIRGRGVAKKFMKFVFEDFIGRTKSNIWLRTDENNIIAGNLYKDFGFKKTNDAKNGEVYMVYKSRNS